MVAEPCHRKHGAPRARRERLVADLEHAVSRSVTHSGGPRTSPAAGVRMGRAAVGRAMPTAGAAGAAWPPSYST